MFFFCQQGYTEGDLNRADTRFSHMNGCCTHGIVKEVASLRLSFTVSIAEKLIFIKTLIYIFV
jgi:hypothetical protein